MKVIFAICCVVLEITFSRVEAGDLPPGDKAKYHQLLSTNGKAEQVISQLEKIQIDEITFEKLSAAEALKYITKRIVPNQGGGVINSVIRGADETKNVGIRSKRMNFAQAVDEICVQSGRVWSIDFNEVSGVPILVLSMKSAIKDNPKGR